MRRRTLAAPVATRGTSLFCAQEVMVAIRPAVSGTGLLFRRVDLPGAPEISATIKALTTEPVHPFFANLPPRCTSLAKPADDESADASPARVATVEHLLGALVAMGITDAIIELDATELPIFDGSAVSFTMLIQAIGVVDLPETIEPITLIEEIIVQDEVGRIVASPRDEPGCVYRYELDYGPHPAIPPQSATWTSQPDGSTIDEFAAQIAPARTFSLEDEARTLKSAGLFPHLTPREMLVLSPMGPIENTLRFENEPARHKLLDLIGDMALVGRPIQATIAASRSGHALNHALARLLANLH